MALYVTNNTGSPVTLAASNVPVTVPANGTFNVTAELQGLSNPDYVALDTQRVAGIFSFNWVGPIQYATPGLLINQSQAGITITNLSALATVNPGSFAIAYISSNKTQYYYDPSSTLTADGRNIVNPGSGRWIRFINVGDEFWRARNNWFLDSVNGNDENDGGSSGAPLKTINELVYRLGGLIRRLTTVNILNTTTPWPLADDWGQLSLRLVHNRAFSGTDPALVIIGQQTTIRTSSFTSNWAVTSGNTGPTLTDTGSANFTSDVGTLVVATSGAANNGLSWFLKDTGSNTARMTTFKQPGFTAAAATVPSSADTYKTCSLTPYAGQSLPTVQGGTPNASVFIIIRNIEFQLAVTPKGPAEYRYSFEDCKFDVAPTLNCSADYRGCYFAAGATLQGPNADYTGQCNGGVGAIVVSRRGSYVDVDTIMQGGANGLSVGDGGYAEITRCGYFDSTGRGVLITNGDLKALVSLFGSGNLVGFNVNRGTARINAFTPTLTGTTELQCDGLTTGIPKLTAGASVPATVSISTWANWVSNTSSDVRNLGVDSFIRNY